MIREMTINDLDEVLEIEKESFLTPWKKEDLLYELKDNPYSTYYVYLEDNKLVGYVGLWVTFDSSQIVNIAVKEEYRHRGIGQKLLDKAIWKAETDNCEFMCLEVRISNQQAINLYEKNGFILVNVKKGYYVDNHEDANYMVKALKVSL